MSEERHEGVVRQDAAMHALVAEMEAVKARIEAMKAANQERERRGESLAYPASMFYECAGELEEIAKALRTEI